MSGFKAEMHQIRFPLTALRRPLAVLNGPTSKAREGKGGEGKEEGKER